MFAIVVVMREWVWRLVTDGADELCGWLVIGLFICRSVKSLLMVGVFVSVGGLFIKTRGSFSTTIISVHLFISLIISRLRKQTLIWLSRTHCQQFSQWRLRSGCPWLYILEFRQLRRWWLRRLQYWVHNIIINFIRVLRRLLQLDWHAFEFSQTAFDDLCGVHSIVKG